MYEQMWDGNEPTRIGGPVLGRDWGRYLHALRDLAAWGSKVEILAAGDALATEIRLVTENGSRVEQYAVRNVRRALASLPTVGTVAIRYEHEHYEALRIDAELLTGLSGPKWSDPARGGMDDDEDDEANPLSWMLDGFEMPEDSQEDEDEDDSVLHENPFRDADLPWRSGQWGAVAQGAMGCTNQGHERPAAPEQNSSDGEAPLIGLVVGPGGLCRPLEIGDRPETAGPPGP